MKILLVNKFLYPNGGSETYLFQLGKALEKDGHEVQYFGMEHPNRIVGNHAESYTSSMDFHTGKLQKLLYPFRIIYSIEARKKIRAVLDNFKPDIVHLNNFNFQITPSVIYEIRKWGKKQGYYVPIVYTAHDYQWVCPNHMLMIPASGNLCFQCKGGKFRSCISNRCIHNSVVKSILGAAEAKLYWYLKTYQKVDLIICPSEFIKKKLEQYPGLSPKLSVLHNFLSDRRPEKVEKQDYVIYFGRYSEEKGVKTLLKVCTELPDILFVFAGSGKLSKKLSDCPNIVNKGFLQGEQLETLIAQARFSVFPSQWYENCPFSVMESQFYGTPVIASRIGGVPELMEDGITGELFKPGDTEELKNKIISLWYDKKKLQVYTENCNRKYFYTAQKYEVLLTEHYKFLKNEKKGII